MIRFYDFDKPVADVELIDGKMVYSHFFNEVAREGIPETVESMRRGRSDPELFHLLPQIFCGQFWAGHANPHDEPGPDDEIVEPV
jgi:hypothetical protein